MKTILYNPIFINPQAYYVFPQLYNIEKGDSFIEPAVYSGYLLIEDLVSNTSSQVTDTREVDFTQFAGKCIRISQYTNIGAVVLGEWLLPEGEQSGPSFHQSLVDAWFMSGPSNSDKPSSITGVMGNEMILKNFDFTSESGFGKEVYDGALVFDGVNDYGICTGLPILDDYTLICKREWIDLSRKSNAAIANKRKVNQTLGGAFNFERLTTSQILTLSFGNYTNIQLSSSGVVYQTKTSYNGDKVISSGSLTDTDSLFLGCSGNGIEFANCAIYYFALYNKSLTPEEIEEEKSRLNYEWEGRLNKKDPTWYTEALICEYNPIKQGCTNQNMNVNILRDLSGNGYHMDCYNFAWNAQSGIYDDGSLILDGVDDYLKVTGLPIMDDFTVMVQNYRYNFKPSILVSKSYPTANDGAFMLENVDGGGRGSLRSFGNPGWVTYIQETVNVMAMTKTECYKDFDNNVNFYVTPGTGVDSDTLWIGKIRDNNSVFGKTRLYSFLMFNRSLTKEEMDWVRNNKMNK